MGSMKVIQGDEIKIPILHHYLLENCKGLSIFEHRGNFLVLVLSVTQLFWDLEEEDLDSYMLQLFNTKVNEF